MNNDGVVRCCHYAFPPNALTLCGPPKQRDISHYTISHEITGGTRELLSQFQTLHPYLVCIAQANRIGDPFDDRVVSAYWIGNTLLKNVGIRPYVTLLEEHLSLRKKIGPPSFRQVADTIALGALPHHAFHVLSIWRRTGNLDEAHTIRTMDACLINWGTIEKVLPTGELVLTTQALTAQDNQLRWKTPVKRIIHTRGHDSSSVQQLRAGDTVSYHWGELCEKLNSEQTRQLTLYTNHAVSLVNISQTL